MYQFRRVQTKSLPANKKLIRSNSLMQKTYRNRTKLNNMKRLRALWLESCTMAMCICLAQFDQLSVKGAEGRINHSPLAANMSVELKTIKRGCTLWFRSKPTACKCKLPSMPDCAQLQACLTLLLDTQQNGKQMLQALQVS